MAGTVQDVALQILAATASDAGVQLAVNWLNQRYAEFCAHARVHQNRHYGSIFYPAPVTTANTNATATVTIGSPTVTLSAPITTPVVGWQIRIFIQWYFIVAQSSDGLTLTLDTPFSEAPLGDNPSTGLVITIVKRFLPVVDPNTRWVSSVIHQRRRKRLTYRPYDQFNAMYPGRTLVAALTWCWTEATRYIETLDISPILGAQGQKFIEIYPPSNQQETYTYVYWTLPKTFAVTDVLPPEVDEYVLREGVLVDVYRYKAEQWAAKGNVEMAAYYGNREARQMTVWQQKIQEAQIADALYHRDIPVECTLFVDEGEYAGDITNAHQWIMSEWTQ